MTMWLAGINPWADESADLLLCSDFISPHFGTTSKLNIKKRVSNKDKNGRKKEF